MMFDMEIAPPVAAIDDDDSVFEAEKSRYASLLFAELSKFQKVGVLCDVQIGRRHPRHDDVAAPNNAHKVVLMSLTSPSASDDDDDRVATPVDVDARDHFRFDDIEDAYAPKRDDDDDDVAHRLHLLNHLRLTRRCCDVTLTCDDGAVCQAHRVVLAACSDYFRAMFTLRMREHEQTRVALRSVSGCCLRRLLHFMYTGETALESCRAAAHLLDAAVYYQMPALVARCCRYLGARVDDSNCCRLTWLARELSLPELADRCLRVAADRFARLDGADSDVELLAADDLIACVRRGAAPEAVAFSVALRWLAANDGSRAAEILAAVRYALIPSADLLAAVARIFPAIGNDDVDVVQSAICDFVSAARGYHDDVHAQPLAQCADTQLREDEARWVCVDGVAAARRVRLPPSSPRVTVVNRPATATAHDDDGRLPIRDPFHAVVEFNGFVFAIGGTRQGKAGFSRNVARYDPRLDTWTSVAAMNEERGDFVAEQVGDVIVVAGGRNRRGYLSTCEMYDPRTNRWSYIASLPQATYMAAGVACGDSLYLSGGFDEHEALNTTLRYDLAADRWTTLPARMLTFRGYHVMVLAPDGRLWAVGGIDHPFAGRNVWEVEAFDVATQRWQFVGQVLPAKPFLSTMRLNATVNSRGRVCVFPVTGARRLPTIEFDADRRMWFEQSDPTPVHQIDQLDADV